MNEKYIATIMKKHLLGNGEAIYTIKETLIGTLNQENNTFIDQDGNIYRHICDKTEAARKLTSQEYYNLTPINQIKEIYPEYTDEDLIETFNKITETLIDQDEPARRLIVEIDRSLEDSDGTGILLTGNSGSGKTLLISLLGKHLNKPFMIIDSTQLTTPGHVGRSIEQYLWELYEMCNYDIYEAEHAIICFDEIDKKGSEKKSDVAGQGVLNTLLKFLDGSTYIACKNPQVVTDGSSVPICTKNMTIIAGGAFSEIYETKEKNSIGFGSKTPATIEKKDPEINDFITKAMMSKEFMARFPVIIRLNSLTEKSLRKILTESTASPLRRQQEKFERRGVTLEVTEDFLDAVAKRAIEREIGARGLHKIIKDTTWKPYDKVKSEIAVYDKVVLDKSTLDNIDSYQLIKRRTSE